MSLPKNVQFQGKKFSPAELKRLEQTANKTLLPIRRGLEATLDAHLKAGDLNFNNTAPRPEDVLSSRVIKSEHPFTYTAIVLKDDPTHVIIKKVLTGGFVPAGPNAGSYSQPISIQ